MKRLTVQILWWVLKWSLVAVLIAIVAAALLDTEGCATMHQKKIEKRATISLDIPLTCVQTVTCKADPKTLQCVKANVTYLKGCEVIHVDGQSDSKRQGTSQAVPQK